MGKTRKQKQKHRQPQRTVQQERRANEKRSTRHPEAARRPTNEKRDAKTKDVRAVGLKKQEPPTCFLCGREIPTKQQLEYTCPKCGNRACPLCVEVMDSLNGVCIACDSSAKKRKAIWDTIAFVGIFVLVAIITLLLVIVICHFAWPARTFYGNGDF
jgi:predicted RNA-binding Zn-ribbon protein involved in translation (DUF1610 family)